MRRMVLTALLKFHASAITYVGNYTGPCLIQLNGEAILVKLHSGVMINKWPYNCIRQFRAEDETGKFSFVSGRRGPYGVAEYNFCMPDDSLRMLQNALTNFTGAQFSTVAPGCGAEQPQPQLPLPPYPPIHPQHTYSLSDPYQMANPKHIISGHQNDSVSSTSGDLRNSILTSLHHSQQFPIPASASMSLTTNRFKVPKLPPRDYSLSSLPGSPSVISEQGNRFSISMDEVMMQSQHKERLLTSSNLTRTSTSIMETGIRSFNAPTLPPKHSHKPAETWVAQSNSYEEISVSNQHSTKENNLSRSATVNGGASSSSGPQKKKLFDRLRGLTEPKYAVECEVKEYETDTDNAENNCVLESSLDVVNLSRFSADQEKLQVTTRKKDTNYDHLQLGKESAEYITPDPEVEPSVSPSGSISPDIITMTSEWKKSPCYGDEAIDLPRSSPTVKVRSITPEHAQKIRRMAELGEGLHGRSLTTSRVSSEGSIGSDSKLLKKSQTLKTRSKYTNGHNSNDTYQVPRPLGSPDIKGKEEMDSIYNVPRPSSATDLYKIPKCVLDSPPNGKRVTRMSPNETDVYNVPRSIEATEEIRRGDSKEDNGVYKIPSSILANSASGGNIDAAYPQDTAKVPVPVATKRDSVLDGVYNFPRGSTFGGGKESVYNIPQPTKTQQSPSPPSFPPTPLDRNDSAERQLPTKLGQMRSTRSFESLHKTRVKNTLTSGFSTMEDRRSDTNPSLVSKGEYVDIDLKSPVMYEDIDLERWRTPAKNAPLPPLPTLGAPLSTAVVTEEGMYCEISDAVLKKPTFFKHNTTSELPNTAKYVPMQNPPRSMTMSQYNEIKSFARPKYPDPSPSALLGLAKAKKLSEEEGYEFCTPASQHTRQDHLESGRTHTVWTTQAIGMESSKTVLSRNRPLSECSRNKIGGADPALLGTSTPADSGQLGDEYVIVTGPDRRLKLGSNPPISAGASTTDVIAEDEYEVMTSARAERIQQRIQSQSQYSTPDPKLYSNCVPNDTRSSSSTQFGGPIRSSVSDECTLSLPHHEPATEESVFAGINIDSMSPSDSDVQPVYFNVSHQRRSSSGSSSSRNSECNEEEGISESKKGCGDSEGIRGVSEGKAIQIPGRSTAIRTLEGSPLDFHESAQLKSLTCSHANVLEEDRASISPLLCTTSTQSRRSSSSTPPPAQTNSTSSTSKRHHYINYQPKENEEVSNTPTQERSPVIPLKNRRPQPLPRASLLRGDSVPSEPEISS